MDACQRRLLSCCLYTINIKQRKKNFGKNKIIEKYIQKNDYVRIAYNYVCVRV